MKRRLDLISVISSAALLAFSTSVQSAELPDSKDEYDLVERKHLEGLFAKPNVGKNFVEGKLSRYSYNARQKGNLRKCLNQERNGLGVAFFRTNEQNHGKLLYTWGIGPKLHLKEVVVFRVKENLILKSVVIGSAGHIDLDTGEGTHKPGIFGDKYNPDLHFSNVDGELMFLSETGGARFLFPMKKPTSRTIPRKINKTKTVGLLLNQRL